MHLLDVFVGEDAAGSLQLALALSRSSGDDGLVQTGRRQEAARMIRLVMHESQSYRFQRTPRLTTIFNTRAASNE